MKRVKVTGYIDIEDYEYDDGPNGPLTADAYDAYAVSSLVHYLDDIEMELVEDLTSDG